MASSFDRLKELNLSRDEVNRLGEALKKEEFRKLLNDYVEELQDPKNREIYEEEVKELERERGQEVTFLHPTPGYVIKTSINGNQKSFINICSNENIKTPSSSPTVMDGARGLQWTLPHSLSPPHGDVDNKGVRCQVYDVLFHPDTLHLGSKNREFRAMINTIALEAVESNFNVTLDKKNFKFPKMSYKGMKRASIMRQPSKEKAPEKTEEEQELFNRIFKEIDSQRPQKPKTKRSTCEDNSPYTTPKYIIKHRSHVDIQEFTEHKNAKLNAAIPKELIVEVSLPLLKGSGDMDLDVTEKTIQLTSEKPAKYKLNLTLPYQVNEVGGTAKFDKDLKKLVIVLPVKRRTVIEHVRDDSGVESCIDSDLVHSDEEEEDSDVAPSSLVDDFLAPENLYTLPEFTCNVFDNVVAFTFNVKNVNENTVHKQTHAEQSLIKVKFTSVSSSFYTSCYAFFVKFPMHQILEDVTVETWDNNVILQVPLKASANQLTSYFYGTNNENLIEKFIEEPVTINEVLEQPEPELNTKEAECDKANIENIEPPKRSNAIDIFATSCESSGDELSASSFSPRKSKGILKRMSNTRSIFGRSVSESSLDDFICCSFENYHGSIECVPEDSREDDGMSSSLKKTVRFNDVVTKQLFRSNSSILGQKKKNQRKARNKKRAHERRYSESEISDVESKKEREQQTGSNETKEESNRFQEVQADIDRKYDSDIFHLEINN